MGRMDLAARTHAFVRTVPRGRVTTYGDVAWAIGRPGAARAVGRVMAAAPQGSPTPCHRVVRSDGRVVPGEEGLVLAERLRQEGVQVDAGGRVRDFGALRWPKDTGRAPDGGAAAAAGARLGPLRRRRRRQVP